MSWIFRLLLALFISFVAAPLPAQWSAARQLGRVVLRELDAAVGRLTKLLGPSLPADAVRRLTPDALSQVANDIAGATRPIQVLLGGVDESFNTVHGIVDRLPSADDYQALLDKLWVKPSFWEGAKMEWSSVPYLVLHEEIARAQASSATPQVLGQLLLLEKYYSRLTAFAAKPPSDFPAEVPSELWRRGDILVARRKDEKQHGRWHSVDSDWYKTSSRIIDMLNQLDPLGSEPLGKAPGIDAIMKSIQASTPEASAMARGYFRKMARNLKEAPPARLVAFADPADIRSSRDPHLWNAEGTPLERFMSWRLRDAVTQWHSSLGADDTDFLSKRFLQTNREPRTRKETAALLEWTEEKVRSKEDALVRNLYAFLDTLHDLPGGDLDPDSGRQRKDHVKVLQAILFYTACALVNLDFDNGNCQVAWER